MRCHSAAFWDRWSITTAFKQKYISLYYLNCAQSSVLPPSCYLHCLPPPPLTTSVSSPTVGWTHWLESDRFHPGITLTLSVALRSLPLVMICNSLLWQDGGSISILYSLPPGTVRLGEMCCSPTWVCSQGLGSLNAFLGESVFSGQAVSLSSQSQVLSTG